jgi:3-hydroxyacyl-CoA dehydrogenase
VAVEVKIGVHNAPRELVLESNQSPEEVDAAVRTALADDNGVLELTDERGRKVIVRGQHLAYVEIGEPIERRVGFGSI